MIKYLPPIATLLELVGITDVAFKIDKPRVEKINEELLSPDMPVIRKGVLYVDGEGTASAAVAKRAAELFDQGKYDRVVFAGGRKAYGNTLSLRNLLFIIDTITRRLVFPKVKEEGLDLPNPEETEAGYLSRVFEQHADPALVKQYKETKKFHVLETGTNTGDKVKACREHFEEVGLVQCVTLAYMVPRLIGTIAKETDEKVAATGERVFPFGLELNTWFNDAIAYATVMGEADNTGPRMDGRNPKYLDKHFIAVDLETEGQRAERVSIQI